MDRVPTQAGGAPLPGGFSLKGPLPSWCGNDFIAYCLPPPPHLPAQCGLGIPEGATAVEEEGLSALEMRPAPLPLIPPPPLPPVHSGTLSRREAGGARKYVWILLFVGGRPGVRQSPSAGGGFPGGGAGLSAKWGMGFSGLL